MGSFPLSLIALGQIERPTFRRQLTLRPKRTMNATEKLTHLTYQKLNEENPMKNLIMSLALLAHPFSAMAADISKGADNFYKSDKVTAQKVTFKNQYNMTVAGNLFIPKSLNQSAENPANPVVGHPMGAVKEQSANLYAQKLADQGFITLSLDLPFWGESEGQPRNAVLPDVYAEAFSAAVDFLGTRPFVDRARIRRSWDLRKWELCHQRGQDRPANEGHRDGQHV